MEIDFKRCVEPYFLSDVIYNESVLMIEDKGVIMGSLAYMPKRIIEICDFTLKKKFDLSDFDFRENRIILKNKSDIPYLTKDNLKGIGLEDKYVETFDFSECDRKWMFMANTIYTESDLYYGHQIMVTYEYDNDSIDKAMFPSYEKEELLRTKELLRNKERVKMVGFGDSIMEGCSASKRYNHEPYQDSFIDMSIEALRKECGDKIEFSNLAVGGKTSVWGSSDEEIEKIIKENPDILYIHFGVNDLGDRRCATEVKTNIKRIIDKVKAKCAKTEFVVIVPFSPNPISYKIEMLEEYKNKYHELSNEYVSILDMYEISKYYLKYKNYYDLCANGINHLNDFTSRLYCMMVLSQLIDFKNGGNDL